MMIYLSRQDPREDTGSKEGKKEAGFQIGAFGFTRVGCCLEVFQMF